MLLQPINVVYHKNASITIVLGAMVMLLLFSSCSGKKKELGDAITERDSMAVMDTRGGGTRGVMETDGECAYTEFER